MDWIASGLILLGSVIIMWKNKWGWAINVLGSILMVYLFLHRPALLILNLAFAIQAAYAFWQWNKHEET